MGLLTAAIQPSTASLRPVKLFTGSWLHICTKPACLLINCINERYNFLVILSERALFIGGSKFPRILSKINS